ncbi:MAG: hypothetical protein NT093_01100 [Candidatus Moranbacteria bacterium]|nr:hypothetical protein [Candidatus Moranbacteria bacterium]
MTSGIPPRLLDRAMIRLPATTIIPIRFSCYSRFEPDAPGEAGWGWTLAGGIGEGLTQGDMLDFPCFIPVAKSGPIRLELFLKSRLGFFAEKRGLANYLYGLSVLLHLSNRGQALKAGFDRPLQKIKFGIFPKKLPNYGPTHGNRWERATIRGKAEVLFGDLLSAAGFPRNAWKKMPGFNIEQFAEFAWWNWKAGTIRLVGYYGTPHDGAYRSVSDTQMGVDLVRAGNPARGEMLLRGYACSAAAGVASEGNEVSKDILRQLGRQHWRLMEQLTG